MEAVSDAKSKKNYVISAYKTKAANQSLDARAPQDTSENAAENTAFVKDSIPNSGENVNEGQKSYTSRTALNSFLNSEMVKRAKQNLEVFQKEIDNEKFNVDRVSESQSIEKAAENISKDYESVVSRVERCTIFGGSFNDDPKKSRNTYSPRIFNNTHTFLK